MKKNIFAIIMFLAFVANAYSVNLNYIPTDSSFVWSIKLDSITSKSEINTQEFINLIFMEKLAESFDDARDDDQVSYAMTNSISSMLDFSKTSRLIYTSEVYSLLIDINDIKEFDLFMLKMARAEDFTIESIYEGKLRYLELDEETLLAWNNNVFSVIVLSDSDDTESVYLLDIADQIFSREGNITDEMFLELEKDKSWDSALWLDYEKFLSYQYYNIWEMLGMDLNDYPIFKAKIEKEYKDASVVVKAFIEDYQIKVVAEDYAPNTTLDVAKLIKKIDKDIYSLVPDSNIGFISFSLDLEEFGKMFFNLIEDTEIETLMEEAFEEVGGRKVVNGLLSILSGDFIVSTTGLDNGEDFFIAMGVKNQKKAIKYMKGLLEDFADGEELVEVKNNGFIILDIDGVYLAFKDKLVYTAFDEETLSYIINGQNDDTLSEEKSTMINDNMLSMFLDIKVLSTLISGSTDEFEFDSITLTSKILSKTSSKSVITLTSKNKDILKTLLNFIEDEF